MAQASALVTRAILAVCAVGIAVGISMSAAAQEKRMGSLSITPCATADNPGILRPLAARGWVVGKNLINDCVMVGDRMELAPQFAAELVARRPDVLVAGSSPLIRLLMKATSTIPIVMYAIPDPVREGFVASLNRPSGNVTGFSHLGIELFGKRIELVTPMLGAVKRVAVLFRTGGDEGYVTAFSQEADRVASTLGFEWKAFSAASMNDFEPVFAQIRAEKFDVVYVVPSPVAFLHRKVVAEAALRHRTAAIGDFEAFAEAGLLMSYGPNRSRDLDIGADYLDKILRGANPASLPVIQPQEFLFVLNTRTAATLGLSVPTSTLQRADKIFD